MKIIYISPLHKTNPHLFPAFKKPLSELGHTETFNPSEATHCFLDVQSGEIKYDDQVVDIILGRKIPIICFDSREFGPMQKTGWHELKPKPDIYFVRNYDCSENYPKNVYSLDWPYFENCDFPPVSDSELFSRPYDICFTGTASPTRENIINGILKDGRLKLYYEFRPHNKRIAYNDWINEHRKAKFFLSCDGGGFTNERPQQLFSVSAMLINKSNHVSSIPFVDGVNCIEINEHPTKDDIYKVLSAVNDSEKLYYIYANGIDHIKKYHSAKSLADYILLMIKENNLA